MKKYCFIASIFFILLAWTLPAVAQPSQQKLLMTWQTATLYNGKDNLGLNLIVKNRGQEPINFDKTELWFNAIFPILEKKEKDYEVTSENGDLFRITFRKDLTLQPQDSLTLQYTSKYPMFNISNVPHGFYFQDKEDASKIYPINVKANPIKWGRDDQNIFWATLYDKNTERLNLAENRLILPTPQTVQSIPGALTLTNSISYWIDPAFHGEMANLAEFATLFSDLRFHENTEEQSVVKIKKGGNISKEGYTLHIEPDGITIEANHNAGVFYALQSLRSLLKPADFQSSSIQLPCLAIQDEPRYAYRGFMMDIARNFKDKATILKYLDLMSRYKLNTFHFHFIDDEGWRIEIPALPELTKIGANRTPLFKNGLGIQPSYGSGGQSTEKHFLTREDFVEILKYAKQRHITVVPEIETPGHARASIKAMEARYHRYMAEGNKAEAEKYLLHDFEDKSVYSSAQYWNDNVMNVALPSVYNFIAVVLDEFKQMYADAGLELKKVSLGGDEVPNGSWEQSPKVKQLMDSLGFKSVYEVWPYYIKKVNKICQEKGLQMAGWEEIGMVNQGKGMDVNPALASANMQLDVWNNLIGGGQEDLAYRLANAGYQVVYISANNNYFDMAWNTNFEEPGLKWATYADLYQSYTFLPENFFANIEHTVNGSKMEKSSFANKIRLTESGKSNLIGVKGGLWAETVKTSERMDYMIFPRLLALAERAWSPKKAYEDDEKFHLDDFNRDYSSFVHKVGLEELPKIANIVRFRLPAVGLKEIDGKLHANTEYPGFAIHYTTDSSTPTKDSPKYEHPISVKSELQYTFATIATDGRAGLTSVFTK